MRNDYIMRVVQQFIQAIASIMQLRKSENYKEARELVRTTGRYLLRADIEVLLLQDFNQILDHFKDFSDRLETEKCVLGATLFQELALIEEGQHRPELARRLKILSLYLYTTGLPQEPQFQTQAYFDRVSRLIEELEEEDLPENVLASIRLYQEFLQHK